MIAILCPTRGRPDQFRRMCESAWSTALGRIWILAYQDQKEERYGSYISKHEKEGSYLHSNGNLAPYFNKCPTTNLIYGEDFPTVYKWNLLAKLAVDKTPCNLFMLGSDDTIFSTPGWDKALIDHYNALENKIHVYHLQDSRDSEGTPHPVVTREYMDAMGYFLPPLFLHWYGDSWTREIAKANGVFTYLKDFLLIHDKPSDKGITDETHNRIRGMGWHVRDMAVNEICQHFLEYEKQRLSQALK